MTFPPQVRLLALTAHVVSSVGFLGAVATFLVLAVASLFGSDPQEVQAAYLAMELITWGVIAPLCFAFLITGVVQSLGTPWGLFRHYWVLLKLLITVFSTLVLMIHTQPISHMAEAAAETVLTSGDLHGARVQLIVAASAAVLALLATTALSIYKPRGLTRFGWRKRYQENSQALSWAWRVCSGVPIIHSTMQRRLEWLHTARPCRSRRAEGMAADGHGGGPPPV
jgi:uncharacterized membrane protein